MSEYSSMSKDDFQSTYGEKPLMTGTFDVDAAAQFGMCSTASVLCMTISGAICVPFVCFCYPAFKQSAQSRKVTLGESSIFYQADTYCCCGPCMCNCNHVEQQVPLEKLQDLKLSQTWLGRQFGVWSVSMETAGQSAQAGPELSLVGLDNPREFKQRCLAQRNVVAGKAGFSELVQPPGLQSEKVGGFVTHQDNSELVPILLRIEEKLGTMQCYQAPK